jgi:hypothetical protein
MDETTDVKEQFLLSRDAVGLANQAFFDPSMMGLLYFVCPYQSQPLRNTWRTRLANTLAGRTQIRHLHPSIRASLYTYHYRIAERALGMASEAQGEWQSGSRRCGHRASC